MAKLQATYNFETFDFNGFKEGKRFALIKADERYKYDKDNNSYTDELSGVTLELEIVTDEMTYQMYGREEKGVNEKVRFTMYVDNPKANIDDYNEMLSDGFQLNEVFITKVDSARLKNHRVGKKTEKRLVVIGDISNKKPVNAN